jgi:hypothetical protein
MPDEMGMVERIARILFRLACGEPCPPSNLHWTYHQEDAREILRALREPTDAMLAAAADDIISYDRERHDSGEAVRSAIEAMIDAALREPGNAG